MRYHLTPVRMNPAPNQKRTSVGKDVETLDPHALPGTRQNGAAPVGHGMDAPQKLKTELPNDSASPRLGIYHPPKLKSGAHIDICMSAFIAAKDREQPRCPSAGEWVFRKRPVHPRKC